MGSYKGDTGSVFCGNPTGGSPGESNFQKDTKVPFGTIRVGYPQDNVHGVSLKNTMGKELAGSETNLAHSLSGASAVQHHPAAPRSGKNTKKEI